MAIRTLCALSLITILGSGCMVTPNHEQPHEDIDQPIAFVGATLGGDQPYQFQIEDRFEPGRWESLGTFYTSTEPLISDVAGTSWHVAAGEVPLPFSLGLSYFWQLDTSDPAQRRVSAQFRAVSEDQSFFLASFDYAGCLYDTYFAEGGAAALSSCQSANTPNARVYVACGQEGQACCYNLDNAEFCDDDLLCNHDTKRCVDAFDIGSAFVTMTSTSDASACVDDMLGQFGASPRIDLGRRAKTFRISDPTNYIYGPEHHNQGVGMLSDTWIGNQRYARAAITFTANDNSGFMVVGSRIDANEEGFYSDRDSIDYTSGRRFMDITDVDILGNHSHPGGMQAHGDLVAVAMEKPFGDDKDSSAAVYFLRMNGLTPTYVMTQYLIGEPSSLGVDDDAAAAAGFIKLADGGYLLAVGGANHGLAGIWFFITEDPIEHGTRWRYLDYWDPDEEMRDGACDIKDGEVSSNCYVGTGGSAALVTDCDGQIYLVALNGTADGGAGIDDEYAQVFRLDQTEDNEVKLTSIWHDKRILDADVTNDILFRWGSGVQVTDQNKLVLLSTERQTWVGDDAYVHGHMRIAGENTRGY